MEIWLTILGMAIVTYGTRLMPLTTVDENSLPLWARRGLKYVPIAVLSAIIGPAYIPSTDWLSFDIGVPLAAGLLAIIVAYFTQNTIITILVGFAAYILFSGI
jgi:branched-subunit amino acid transport protein